jgi:MHS family proline/betaine transporter-like MFS transporter
MKLVSSQGGYLVDRYRAGTVALVSAVTIGILVVPCFLLIQRGTVAWAILGQIPIAACLGVAATFGAMLSASLFPAEVRYTASGVAHNVSVTLFGSTAPYVSTWLIARTGSASAPAWYLAGMALVGVTVAAVLLVAGRAPAPTVRGHAAAPSAPG